LFLYNSDMYNSFESCKYELNRIDDSIDIICIYTKCKYPRYNPWTTLVDTWTYISSFDL
jgi:hypothetical protein